MKNFINIISIFIAILGLTLVFAGTLISNNDLLMISTIILGGIFIVDGLLIYKR